MRKRARQRTPLGQTLIPVMFTLLLAGAGALGAWHMYEVPEMFVAVFASALIGVALAWLLRRVRWWWRVLALFVAYMALVSLLTLPEMLRDLEGISVQALRIIMAPVTAWKDILTLDLPLGSYQAVLAPVVLLTLAASFASVLLAWQGGKASGFAPIISLTMPIFGLVFGSSVINTRAQMAIGVFGFAMTLLWLVWRSVSVRHQALRLSASTAPRSSNTRGTWLTRVLSGSAIVLVAVGVGVFSTPAMLSGATRDVLRTNLQPEIAVDTAVSPLSTFRNYRGNDLDTTLFSVSAPQMVQRVRLATMGTFDGVTMRPGVQVAANDHAEFRRVPSVLPREAEGLADVTVTLEQYDDMWVPLAGDLVSVRFEGRSPASLTDGFFYQRDSGTGVQLSGAGFTAGDRIHARVDATTSSSLGLFQPARSGPSLGEDLVPQSLTTWMTNQGVTLNGQGLESLVERLRARGYLSHSIVNDEGSQLWMERYGVSVFEASRAGHSTARIDRLFTDLNTREAEVGSDAPDHELVAAVGDDEQFAVAAYLIADAMGFESRVTLGFKLDATDGVPACELGTCAGSHMTAWLEVRDAATGEWGIIDVTPQYEVVPHAETTRTSEPKHHTQVENQHGDIVPPPEATPNQGGTPPNDPETVVNFWEQIWPIVKWVSVGVLALIILATPFWVIAVLKLMNTRARRRSHTARAQLVGAWDEFVDRAVDFGAPFPRNETRREYARQATADPSVALRLAEQADTASFSASPIDQATADDYWQMVADAHAEMRGGATRWGRIRSRFSARSLRATIRREVTRQSVRM